MQAGISHLGKIILFNEYSHDGLMKVDANETAK